MPPRISTELVKQVIAAARRDDNTGICLACGEEYPGEYEPDARECKCEACGEHRVYGAEECLLHIA